MSAALEIACNFRTDLTSKKTGFHLTLSSLGKLIVTWKDHEPAEEWNLIVPPKPWRFLLKLLQERSSHLPPYFFNWKVGFKARSAQNAQVFPYAHYSHLAIICTYISGKACKTFLTNQIHFSSVLPHHQTGHAAADGTREIQAGASPRVIPQHASASLLGAFCPFSVSRQMYFSSISGLKVWKQRAI